MPPVDVVIDVLPDPSPASTSIDIPVQDARRRRRAPGRWLQRIAVGWLVALTAASLLEPFLPLAEGRNPSKTLLAPFFASPKLASSHPLGTNRFGLDLLSRALYGARVSLLVAVAAALIGLLVGGALGIIAGERRGWLDRVVGVFSNALLAVPGLVLLIAVVSVVGHSHVSRTVALGVLAVPINLRLARATTMRVAKLDYVTVARILGTSRRQIMMRELVPNVARPLLAYLFVLIPLLIVADASLSFLGLGTPQPDPTWGNMIAEGLGGVFEDHPHIVFVPAIFMFLTVFSLDVVAGRLRRRLDPKGGGA